MSKNQNSRNRKSIISCGELKETKNESKNGKMNFLKNF